jgi:hypothetical protein
MVAPGLTQMTPAQTQMTPANCAITPGARSSLPRLLPRLLPASAASLPAPSLAVRMHRIA